MDRVQIGDILSESSHYIVKNIYGNKVDLQHYESGNTVTIDASYIRKYAKSADEVIKVVEVTKEDKRDGTPGIRSIWESIHSGQVFTVCFKKQDKPRSNKAVNDDIDARTEAFIQAINKAKAQKKSIANVAREHFVELMKNPILDYVEGKNRVLRGYKIQFYSRDGKYDCVDMDLEKTNRESGVRSVNINTISWLIYNGIKYIVK